jgi:F-type H+-transporting ATPase subunit delta
VRQSIRGYTDGVVEQAADSGQLQAVASDLAGVRDLVERTEELQRALVDPGIPASGRRGIVTDLFDGKVGTHSLRLLVSVVDRDRAGETIANISWLALRAEAATRSLKPTGDTILGHRAAEERVDGYAAAVLESVPARSHLAEIEDQLFRFLQTVRGATNLRETLSNRTIPSGARRQIVVDLLTGKADPTTVRLAAYCTQVGRPRDYEDLLDHLVQRVAAESNRRLAEVRAATDLDRDQQDQLAAALRRVIGHEVEVRVTVDPSLLAGFVATVGDTVVDGSARHRLELLKERLEMPEATAVSASGTTSTGDPV